MNLAANKWLGHLSVFTAYSIFGFNIIVCKDLTTHPYISPMGIFMLRSVGAGLIFWILSLFVKQERVATKDLPGIFLASFFGYFLTQLTFLTAIPMITPMESSIMSSLSPVYTMLIAAVALREPITLQKVSGVLLSFAGIIYLILTGMSGSAGGLGSNLWGLILMVGNALFFSIYLGVFRPLIERYSVITFMKWIFLFSALMALPFSAKELTVEVDYTALPATWIAELGYLIVLATFVAYFLIPLGQKIIRPTLVSMYSYMQPIIAIGISIAIGLEALTFGKCLAATMVFVGVYIVSRSKSAKQLTNK